MTEDKFTDEEIKKGLERVISCNDRQIASCEGCPFEKAYPYCDNEIEVECLALINRYEAEIARLTAGQKILHKCIASIKAEAIKDFAKRLKKKAFISSSPYSALKVVAVFDIAVLEQQMTEEQE